MSKSGIQPQLYLGVVDEPFEDMSYRIKADIPGIIQGINAYPIRGELDEPKPGDPIVLLGLDPEYNSYYLYWKLKENDFTGIRAFGQQISFNKDSGVRISVDSRQSGDGKANYPADSDILPGSVARIDIDGKGKIEATNSSGAKIYMDSEGTIRAESKSGSALKIGADGRIELDSTTNIVLNVNGGTIKFSGAGTIDFGTILSASGTPTGFIDSLSFGDPGSPIPFTSRVTFMGD